MSDQTEDRIRDLLPQSAIDSDTRFVLTNAIYFKAAWKFPFAERLTRDGVFHLLDDSQVSVPMMEGTAGFGYAEGEGVEAIELPYEGGELSMVVLLPAAGWFEEFETTLDTERVAAILGDIVRRNVHLTMPKFTYESEFRLKDALVELGMPDAFENWADFSGITEISSVDERLKISDVFHKAFVSVDEAGTEAAAATAVVIIPPALPLEVRLDRPFLFIIRDIETGAILFLGRVVNPVA